VHAETVDLGGLTPQPPPSGSTAELAPDQLAAVEHGAGPARIIAPAGSGKTRVLTQRYRHVLVGRGYDNRTTIALAYNKKAQEEMASRLHPLDARIETINAWGYALLSRALGRRPQVADEPLVRNILEGLLPKRQRRVNTDPMQPYLDGLALIRLGLRSPEEVEESLDDVGGLAEAFAPYRQALRDRGVIDFDEQVYGAVECLLQNGEFRRAMQREHRHVLVDELQDLTPAHVLLIRIVAGPAADVFGVGDDDQEIYGHVGADPRFLINYRDYFPGAAEHALQVNYRCPAVVTKAAATLLGYNHVRVTKTIEPGPSVVAGDDAFAITTHASEEGATALHDVVGGWLAEPDVLPAEVAVLARVRSLLLAPHVVLSQAGIPVNSILGEDVLRRLGVRAALSYLRIAASPDRVDGSDLIEVYRRPSRGLPQWADKWLRNCRSVDSVARVADQIDDPKVSVKFAQFASDLEMIADVAATGATSRQLLLAIRDRIGLGSAMTLLDSTGGASGSHLDDLEALLQVADLHPDPVGFGGWLSKVFHRESNDDGVTLSTIHRVKGREWDRVVVFGATDGVMPHRLAEDVEEERRVLHVGITRGRHRVVVLGDRDRRSPFLDELTGAAPHRPPEVRGARIAPAPKAAVAKTTGPVTIAAVVGMSLIASGGYDGVVEEITDTGVSLRLDAGSVLSVRFGERVTVDGQVRELAPPFSELSQSAEAALRAWRTERSRADGMPAYIVLSDKHLAGVAAALPRSLAELRACPGIGPAKIESYGDDILGVLEQVRAASE
jgi:DNA helicase-2/ATP-dependent DNA helicase PcrA